MRKKNRTYEAWSGMRKRCTNPRSQDFAHYGGRGITICARWSNFAFFREDMGDCPPGMTLERNNVNRGYGPENCRWASRKDQSRNRRDTIMLTKDGQTKCLAEWAELLGLKAATIHMRLHRGWSQERSLSTSTQNGRIRRSNRIVTFNGQSRPLFEWAKLIGIPRKTLTLRFFYGWSAEKALTTPVRRW